MNSENSSESQDLEGTPTFDDSDVDLSSNSPEFAHSFEEIREDVETFKREVLEPIEPSRNYRSSMRRMLVDLVRMDVHQQFRQASPIAWLGRGLARWSRAWKELYEGSGAFRTASQGALALGVGLMLVFMWETTTDGRILANDSEVRESVDQLPRSAFAVPPGREVEPLDAAGAKRLSEQIPRPGKSPRVPSPRKNR